MFSIKIFSKFIRVEIRFDCGDIEFADWYTSVLGRPKFSMVSDSTFWKMMSFETKWIAFFRAKSRCFVPRSRSPAKAMRYTDETLSFQNNAIRATQWSNIFKEHQHWLFKHSDSPGIVSTLWCKKATWLNSCFNKIKFCARLPYECDVIDNFFNHIYQKWFTLVFLLQTFFQPGTWQERNFLGGKQKFGVQWLHAGINLQIKVFTEWKADFAPKFTVKTKKRSSGVLQSRSRKKDFSGVKVKKYMLDSRLTVLHKNLIKM